LSEREPIIVGEYDPIRIGPASKQGHITREEADEVLGLREDFGCKNPSEWFRLRYNRKEACMELTAGAWVGVLNLSGIQISVYPKIDPTPDKGAHPKPAPRADLLAMLVGAGLADLDPKEVPKLDQSNSFIDHLAILYNQKLLREITRGLPHSYVEKREMLGTLRGRIDFERQMVATARGLPTLACTYDSFEVDTRLNRVLKAGLRAARSLVHDKKTKQALRRTEEVLDEVQDVAVSEEYARATPISRSSRHLESLKQWAVIFLSRKTLDIRGDAKGRRGAGLMFRMWDVYERYVINQLNQTLAEVGKKAGCRLHAVGQKREWSVAEYKDDEGSHSAFTLKPDILIYRDDQPIMIADTKWKVLNDEEDAETAKLGVSQPDVYQMMAYTQIITPAGEPPLPLALLYPEVGKYTATGCSSDAPLAHLGEPVREFTLDPKDQSKISLKILHFPLPVG
jgi:5-methylcytosine-specific restriction endonuclease McrBC regulatory subunit McrC